MKVKIPEKLMIHLMRTLIRICGDHIMCPHCGKSFIPNTILTEDTLILHKKLDVIKTKFDLAQSCIPEELKIKTK